MSETDFNNIWEKLDIDNRLTSFKFLVYKLVSASDVDIAGLFKTCSLRAENMIKFWVNKQNSDVLASLREQAYDTWRVTTNDWETIVWIWPCVYFLYLYSDGDARKKITEERVKRVGSKVNLEFLPSGICLSDKFDKIRNKCKSELAEVRRSAIIEAFNKMFSGGLINWMSMNLKKWLNYGERWVVSDMRIKMLFRAV